MGAERGDEGVEIRVRAQPGSSRESMAFDGNTLKVWVHAPAVDGKANKRLCEFLAETFGVRRSQVVLLRGPASKDKVFLVKGLAADEIMEKLDRLRRWSLLWNDLPFHVAR